jgi:DNA-binding transcriptional ArsR family regulator
MSDEVMNRLFAALADSTRRRMLDILKDSPGLNVNQISSHFDMSRIGVMKHLKVLERAELVISEREGRNRRLYFNVVPIQEVYERWTTTLSRMWAGGLVRLRDRLEERNSEHDQKE